jgi:hypothetical protein
MREYQVRQTDLATMEPISLASSYEPGRLAWTTLGLYYRPGFRRPFVSASLGWTREPADGFTGNAQQWLEEARSFGFACGTFGELDRALRWFDDTRLADTLRKQAAGWQRPLGRRQRRGYEGEAKLSAALEWLYPEGDMTPGGPGRALLAERDFIVSQRTVNDALKAEREGRPAVMWVRVFLATLRHFDRAAWIAAKEAAHVA